MNTEENFKKWDRALAHTRYHDQLLAMDAEERSDAFYRYMSFGTAGMRGILGPGTNRMNVYTVRRATQGLADWLRREGKWQSGVCIAYDSRHMSREFARDAALILAKNGVKAYLYESLRSVPQLSFTILDMGCAAGIVVTASHNPPKYNGYKVYGPDGGQLAPTDADDLTSYIERVEDYLYIEPMDECEAIDKGLLVWLGTEADERFYDYERSLLIDPELVKRHGESLRVVYTPLHGAGNVPVRRLLSDIGMKHVYVVPEQEKPDGDFPTVAVPNPEDPRAFELAMKLADEKQAGIIIATDPDCDRLGVAVRKNDGEFKVLSGNEIGCLLMDYVLAAHAGDIRKGDFVVKSVVSSPMADRIAAHYGVDLRVVLTGFRFIAEQIKLAQEKGDRFLFGYEESYGFLAGARVRDKDAASSSMLIVEAACAYAERKMTLADAVDSLYDRYGWHIEKGLSVTREGESGLEEIASTVEHVRSDPPRQIAGRAVLRFADYRERVLTDMRTGEKQKLTLPQTNMLYFELEGGRVILRPSGTEPKLKAYCCAVDADRQKAAKALEEIVSETKKLM